MENRPASEPYHTTPASPGIEAAAVGEGLNDIIFIVIGTDVRLI